MRVDAELEAWRREWRSGGIASSDLARKVRRHSAYRRLMLFTEVLVTISMGGGVLLWALQSPQADVIVLAIAVWFFLSAAWTFGVKNRKDCWTPAAMTTAAFLDISIRRCQAVIRTSTFAVLLYTSEMLFCLGWIYNRKSHEAHLAFRAFLTSPLLFAVSICTVAFLAAIVWYRRRKQNELACLLQLRLNDMGDAVAPHDMQSTAMFEVPLASRVLSRFGFKRRKRFRRV
jgi:hypothetical protein